ncbi:transcriptional repressor LexA [Pseudomarimonas arenosa]|uniref:LexA repressor n=1 Tax=Pseudomarimonas arenosa TaxID=2774145 RepID=A0AAW3ZPV0_9GAMM|nr:transcriptional repressor LexA [Pseudomarimonas arenosa]MBD8526326.1 transcriptional repressor LexA [Pseudomarimonas arenosa]
MKPPRSTALTERQQAVLDFLREHQVAHGLPPTLSELATAFEIQINAARKHLQALAEKQAIELLPGKARGLRLLSTGSARRPAKASAANPEPLWLPLVGRVAAGAPILSEGHIEGRFALDPTLFRPKPDFLLRVEGDSMIEAGIFDGDLIAVRRSPEALNGQIVVARLEGEITVKRLHTLPGRLQLLPANAAYAPIEVPLDANDFAIEGLYVGSIRRG